MLENKFEFSEQITEFILQFGSCSHTLLDPGKKERERSVMKIDWKS